MTHKHKKIKNIRSTSEIISPAETMAMDKVIKRGLQDSREGKTLSNIEMKKRIQQW